MIALSISIDAGKKKLLKKLAKELGYNLEKAIKQVFFIAYLKRSICQFKKKVMHNSIQYLGKLFLIFG